MVNVIDDEHTALDYVYYHPLFPLTKQTLLDYGGTTHRPILNDAVRQTYSNPNNQFLCENCLASLPQVAYHEQTTPQSHTNIPYLKLAGLLIFGIIIFTVEFMQKKTKSPTRAKKYQEDKLFKKC